MYFDGLCSASAMPSSVRFSPITRMPATLMSRRAQAFCLYTVSLPAGRRMICRGSHQSTWSRAWASKRLLGDVDRLLDVQ